MKDSETNNKTVAENRKARHEYFVLADYEAGISLCGTEVKSIRQGSASIQEAWCDIERGELYIKGMYISPYEKGNIFNRDPVRNRKMLMHHVEIMKLLGQIKQDGLTLIPLSLYLKEGKIKVHLGLCKGKKNYDKREDMAKRDAERDIGRAMKERGRRSE